MLIATQNTCTCMKGNCNCNPWKLVDDNNQCHSTWPSKFLAEDVAMKLNLADMVISENNTDIPTLVDCSKAIYDQLSQSGKLSLYAIMNGLTSECGELADEITIEMGDSYKPRGPDGVVGESIDVILSALVLIYKYDPTMTENYLSNLLVTKGMKWVSSSTKK